MSSVLCCTCTIVMSREYKRNRNSAFWKWDTNSNHRTFNQQTMISELDRQFIEIKKVHLEQSRLDFVQGLDNFTTNRFHQIHERYIGAYALTVWCSSCVMQMLKRIDEWYKTLPVLSSVPTQEENSSCDVPIVQKEIKRRRRRHII